MRNNNYGLLFVIILLMLFTISTCGTPEVQASEVKAPQCTEVHVVQSLHNGMYFGVGCTEQGLVVATDAKGNWPRIGTARIVTIFQNGVKWYELHQGSRTNPLRFQITNW